MALYLLNMSVFIKGVTVKNVNHYSCAVTWTLRSLSFLNIVITTEILYFAVKGHENTS